MGHGASLSHPDYTYRHGNWQLNEARTLEMEKRMYALFAEIGGTGAVHPLSEIEKLLEDFNKIPEHEDEDDHTAKYQKTAPGTSRKIQLLQSKLNEWGITEVNWTNPGPTKGIYSADAGAANRNKFLCDANNNALDQRLYQGTILPLCNTSATPGPDNLPPGFQGTP